MNTITPVGKLVTITNNTPTLSNRWDRFELRESCNRFHQVVVAISEHIFESEFE